VRVAARLPVEPFVGTNCFYLLTRARDSPDNGERKQVTDSLDDIKSMGMTVIRAWAFQDDPNNSTPVHYKTGVDANGKPVMAYNDDMLRGLKWMLDEANKRGLKMMLTLTNGQPSDYGGIRQYYRWVSNLSPDAKVDCGDFFRSQPARALYKDYVTKIVNDFKNHPALHSWDIINEPRNTLRDAKSDEIAGWIHETATLVKSLDPKHPVTAGVEGFYGPAQHGKGDGSDGYNPYGAPGTGIDGCDWVKEIQSPALDFASIHLYPASWANYAAEKPVEFSKKWVQTHIDEIRKAGLDIPLVLQEYNLKPPFEYENERTDMFKALGDLMLNPEGAYPGVYIGNVVWMAANPARASDDGEKKFLYALEYNMGKQNDDSVTVLMNLAKEVEKRNGPKPS